MRSFGIHFTRLEALIPVEGKDPVLLAVGSDDTVILNNIDDVKKQFNLPDGKWAVKPVMIVSEEIISNTYYKKGESILVYSNLTEIMIRAI